MTFQEWKDQFSADITDLYFDFLADTDQESGDCSIIEFAEYFYTQTEHAKTGFEELKRYYVPTVTGFEKEGR